nr:MAG TPA: hypothetical protein [Caudoviricetes sp.]
MSHEITPSLNIPINHNRFIGYSYSSTNFLTLATIFVFLFSNGCKNGIFLLR